MTSKSEMYKNSFPLKLKEIASWHKISEITDIASIQVRIPIFQRGLVWNPGQIELLWDSILRGFPIGALVLCDGISGQTKKLDKPEKKIYHLLDGQQRCDAIALGYKDPFFEHLDGKREALASQAVLWIDLNPDKDEQSTRDFVIRITTPSHPWGYTCDDSTKSLTADEIRMALKRINLNPALENYKRPTPALLCPQQAKAPIPLSWLLLNQGQTSSNLDDDFCIPLRKRLKQVEALPWHGDLISFLNDPNSETRAKRVRIFEAVNRLKSFEIVALCAPELHVECEQEKSNVREHDNITSVEHLFQRLNRQGTPLDGEELAYSMIKAYWPELAEPIDNMEKPMPATRLISLGIRAALTLEKEEGLLNPLSVSQIRKLAGKEDKQSKLVHNYIQTELEQGCSQINNWLRYDVSLNPSGLLPVHIASIAHGSPDIFLLMLMFAKRPISEWRIPDVERAQCLQALGTITHWFGEDNPSIANLIYSGCRKEISLANIQTALVKASSEKYLRPIHSPDKIEAFFRNFDDSIYLNWNWNLLGQENKPEEERQKIWNRWGAFFWFRGEKELLLYAQREFLSRRYADYDPARKDLWKDHNRPWDFDHILANTFVRGKQGKYRKGCAEWIHTIGNLRAWPMEDNRSEKSDEASLKFGGNDAKSKCENSFLNTNELPDFSNGIATCKDPNSAILFVNACRTRMLRIYQNWYQTLNVSRLVPSYNDISGDRIDDP